MPRVPRTRRWPLRLRFRHGRLFEFPVVQYGRLRLWLVVHLVSPFKMVQAMTISRFRELSPDGPQNPNQRCLLLCEYLYDTGCIDNYIYYMYF